MNAIIDIKDLRKTYDLGEVQVHALASVSATIYQGQFVSIMGHSGSGKSTMLNILGCLDTPTSGQYILNNNHVMNMDEDDLAHVRNQEIGFVFQSFNLLPRYNALENVGLPLIYAGINKADRMEMSQEALRKVGLGDRSHSRPNQMSGGQRQRVAIARALVNNPSLLLADEPTGNLDTATTMEIMDLFVELHEKGNTIVVVTHEDEIAACTQRQIILKDGEIESDLMMK